MQGGQPAIPGHPQSRPRSALAEDLKHQVLGWGMQSSEMGAFSLWVTAFTKSVQTKDISLPPMLSHQG